VRSGLVKDFIIKKAQYENPKFRIVPMNAGNFTEQSKAFH